MSLRPVLARAALVAAIALCATPAAAQLRIATYNTATGQSTGQQTARSGMDVILEAIGSEVVNDFAKKLDVLMLQEQFSMAVSAQSVVDVLNGIYGAGVYARSTVNGLTSDPQGDGGRPGLVYNTQTVQLLQEVSFGAVNSSAQARSTLRYLMQPVGYDPSARFYLYNSHYKADEGTVNQGRRDIEAQSIRANADALGDGAHIVYAGDYNVYRSSEPMYQTLLSAGPGQANDPINMPGSWNNSAAFKAIHTQAPQDTPQFPGQTPFPGGMDDRFDFQLVSGEMLDNEGMSYISGSYRAFGNNGTHNINGAITTGTGAAPAVLNALHTVSDHLPVVADYQLPAKMNVQFGVVPTMVDVGATIPIDVLVQNIAPALTVGSVDELDYTITVSGDLLGGVSGIDFALGGGNAHQVMLNTGTSGMKSGLITVAATSQSAASPLFTLPVSFQVGEGDGGGPTPLPPNSVMRMAIARDDFDAPLNRISYAQTPAPGAFASSADGFERYQIGVSSSIPFDLIDQTTSGSPTDTFGIVVQGAKTDGWFGIADTDNPDNVGGASNATWQFDVAGASGLEVSIDMGAIGDFEAGADAFNWTYSIDGGPFQLLFSSTVDEAAQKTYTFANGNMATHQDPMSMTPVGGSATELSNVLQTLTAPLSGSGATLSLRLDANTNGDDEAFAFDNIIVTGLVSFLASDFDKDGFVDTDDLATWQSGYGIASGATKAQGDADNDGDVDSADLLVWQRQLGAPQPSVAASAAVPEPSAVAQWLATLAAGATFRRRRTAA